MDPTVALSRAFVFAASTPALLTPKALLLFIYAMTLFQHPPNKLTAVFGFVLVCFFNFSMKQLTSTFLLMASTSPESCLWVSGGPNDVRHTEDDALAARPVSSQHHTPHPSPQPHQVPRRPRSCTLSRGIPFWVGLSVT